ncbi:unnamed protein product [Lepidochelys kempii]
MDSGLASTAAPHHCHRAGSCTRLAPAPVRPHPTSSSPCPLCFACRTHTATASRPARSMGSYGGSFVGEETLGWNPCLPHEKFLGAPPVVHFTLLFDADS